jgi:hypothetical protein
LASTLRKCGGPVLNRAFARLGFAATSVLGIGQTDKGERPNRACSKVVSDIGQVHPVGLRGIALADLTSLMSAPAVFFRFFLFFLTSF